MSYTKNCHHTISDLDNGKTTILSLLLKTSNWSNHTVYSPLISVTFPLNFNLIHYLVSEVIIQPFLFFCIIFSAFPL